LGSLLSVDDTPWQFAKIKKEITTRELLPAVIGNFKISLNAIERTAIT
jgi:hypothetical protein